jgi:hypothetical protein
MSQFFHVAVNPTVQALTRNKNPVVGLVSVAKYVSRQIHRLPFDVVRQLVEDLPLDGEAPRRVDALLVRWPVVLSDDTNTIPELCFNSLVRVVWANSDSLSRIFEELRTQFGRVMEYVRHYLLALVQTLSCSAS